jgi:predicted O-methyltransferase YrrM
MNARRIARISIEKKLAAQKVTELSPLISLLKRRKLRTLVEIGTAKGGTLYAWCKIAEPDATIVSIDLPGGPFGGGYTLKEKKTIRRYKRKYQKIYFLRKDSSKKTTIHALKTALRGSPVDFLFIDGDHRYTGVKKDFILYSPMVKENGLIVVHDILHHPKVPQCRVDRLWGILKKSYRFREITDPEDDRGWGQWAGIGVLHYSSKVHVQL